jgi:hypothetical protein
MDGGMPIDVRLWNAVCKDDTETCRQRICWIKGWTVVMGECFTQTRAMVDLLLKREAEVNRTAWVS